MAKSKKPECDIHEFVHKPGTRIILKCEKCGKEIKV